jgi:hypothetical protein
VSRRSQSLRPNSALMRPNETLKRTSAGFVEVVMVERLAGLGRIQHRCAGESSFAA